MRWIRVVILIIILYGLFGSSAVYTDSIQFKNTDERGAMLEDYLIAKKSPLASSSFYFIKIADKYKLDWKLLPAIAGVESGFEKGGNIYDFNPFGYMCASGPCHFKSYEEAIDKVAKTISRGNAYKEFRGSGRIRDLAKVYNYVSPDEWTEKVKYFESELK